MCLRPQFAPRRYPFGRKLRLSHVNASIFKTIGKTKDPLTRWSSGIGVCSIPGLFSSHRIKNSPFALRWGDPSCLAYRVEPDRPPHGSHPIVKSDACVDVRIMRVLGDCKRQRTRVFKRRSPKPSEVSSTTAPMNSLSQTPKVIEFGGFAKV